MLLSLWAILLLPSCQRDERALVVGKIQQASDLVTSEFVIDKVVFGKKSRNLLWFRMNEAKFLAYSQARVKTGIDLTKIKEEDIDALRDRADIVEIVSNYTQLKKSGSNTFKGLCPIHSEKTPSFHVNPDMGIYKCFGCGKSGDLITFVRETEQLNFAEAVEALGKRFGIVIEYEEGSGGPTREERSLRQEIFDLHEAAALDGVTGRFFDGLRESRAKPQAYDPAARQRLRQLSDELIARALPA